MRSLTLANQTGATRVVSRFTEGESTFRNAKLRPLALVAYKTFADAAGKGSLFVVTIIAARRLTPWAFGVFGLGTTLGWMLSVVADFGVQMHLARAVAQTPDTAGLLLRRWWRVRWMATLGSVAALTAALTLFGGESGMATPLVVFAAAYACSSLVEFINYFYRGLSRTDIESTLTIAQRGATLALAVAVLIWKPDVTWLAVSMLVPAAGALIWSARTAMVTDLSPAIALHGTTARRPSDTFARDVFPIGIGIVLAALYFRIDVLLVQVWAGTEAGAAHDR